MSLHLRSPGMAAGRLIRANDASSRREHLASGILLLGFVLSAGIAPLGAATPAEAQSWLETRSSHYTVFSSAPARRTIDLVKRLERFDQTLTTLFTRGRIESPEETFIYIFKDDASMTPYKLRYQGKPVELGGFYLPARDAHFIVLNGSAQSDPLPTIYHESMHQFTQRRLPPLPAWFNEGLAECYETFRTDGETAQIGRVKEEHISLLRALPTMSLTDLFAVTRASSDYNEGDRRSVFYAESWALVHYLLWDNRDRARQLVRFLDGLGLGKSVDEAFQAAFEVSVQGLEAELKRHIAQNRFHHTIAHFKEMSFDETATSRPLRREEVFARLGDLLAHMGPEYTEDAEVLLRKGLDAATGDATAARALGLVRLNQERTVEAIALFERALRVNPQEGRAAFHLAELLLDRHDRGPGDASAGPGPDTTKDPHTVEGPTDDLRRARALLNITMQTRPAFAEAAVVYARSLLGELNSPEPATLGQGIAALEKARLQIPYRPEPAAYLAILYALQGNFDRAKMIVERDLPHLADRGALEFARNTVNFYKKRSDSAAPQPSPASGPGNGTEGDDGRLPRPPAVDPVGQPGSAPIPSPLPEDPEARLLFERALAGTTTIDYNDAVAIYNRAVALANQRRYKDSIVILQRLLTIVPFDDLRDKIKPMIVILKKDALRLGVPVD